MTVPLRDRLARRFLPHVRLHDRVLCPDARHLAETLVDLVLSSKEWQAREAVVEAVKYAMGQGCFSPVPEPPPEASLAALTRWGAMRHLHDAFAAFTRLDAGKEEGG